MGDMNEVISKSRQVVQQYWGKALSSFVVVTEMLDMLETGHYLDFTVAAGSATIATAMGPVGSTVVIAASKWARSQEEQAILDTLPKEKNALEQYARNEAIPYIDRVIAISQFSVLDAIERGDWRAYLAADASRSAALKQKVAERQWLGPSSSLESPMAPLGGVSSEIEKHDALLTKSTSYPLFRDINDVHEFVLTKLMQERVAQDFASEVTLGRNG